MLSFLDIPPKQVYTQVIHFNQGEMMEIREGEVVAAETQPVVFPGESPVEPCSWNECTAGHRWPPVLAVAGCPGCRVPILAVQQVNCPVCNEPMVRSVVRSDFVPKGAGVASRCRGGKVAGESLTLEMERVRWKEVESSQLELFEDRMVRTDGKG